MSYLPSHANSGWISVNDSLPPKNGNYLVYYVRDMHDNYSMTKQEVMYFYKTLNRFEFFAPDITHWQPLPESPKE